MYAEAPDTFDALIAPFPATIQEVATWVRNLILRECPNVSENIHGGKKVANALYSVGSPDRVALGIQPGPHFVKLFIHDPDQLPDTPFKLEGNGKHMRHVKLRSIPTEQRDALIALMMIPVDRRS